jgi:hypothetical protein
LGLNDMSLVPTQEYVQPEMVEARTVFGAAIDIGADEVGGTSPLGPVNGDDPVGTPTGSGGCCQAPGDAPPIVLVMVCAFLLGRVRRGASHRAYGRSSRR